MCWLALSTSAQAGCTLGAKVFAELVVTLRTPHRCLVFLFVLSSLTTASGQELPGQQSEQTEKRNAKSPRILSAKTVYLKNATSSDSVGKNALDALIKWGKFQVVADPSHADLIFLLSSDPYKGGDIIFASGQTGEVDGGGQITKDSGPTFNKLAPTKYAYLTVIDRRSGEDLWDAEHVWGGLLTGFNSVGARLVKKLEDQTKR